MDSSRPERDVVGVYVHVPFCARACPYCDFDFVVGRNPETRTYLDGLAREFTLRRDALASAEIATLYVGGGTPSLLPVNALEEILRTVGGSAGGPFVPEEVTVEANPEHVTVAWARAMKSLGVHRISLGTQSFVGEGLVTLGRAHGAVQGRRALERLVAEGLSVSADLIVGWPGQGVARLDRELSVLLETGVGHISVYALTIEEDTPWTGLVARGMRSMPEPDLQAALLETCEARLCAAGFEHYEIASYARPGQRARHNQRYWRWEDFIGVGPSAASAMRQPDGGLLRTVNPRGLGPWLEAVASAADVAPGTQERLSPEAAACEGLWLGLRMLEPLDVRRLEQAFARGPGWAHAKLAPLVERGIVRTHGPHHVAVGSGQWLLHDTIAETLLG